MQNTLGFDLQRERSERVIAAGSPEALRPESPRFEGFRGAALRRYGKAKS